MKQQQYDALVIGCGFSGAVCARVLAAEQGLRVLILEKRSHIAGNMYDEPDENGVLLHRYGPHIFHTNSPDAFAFIEPFADWVPYEHRVLGRIDGKLVPIPFNFTSLDVLFPADFAGRVKEKLKVAFPTCGKVTVSQLMEAEDTDLATLGQFVFDKVFKNYTAKQWGTAPETLDAAVLNRVPVVLSYDDRYFTDAIQKMPRDGYTALFAKLLDHPNITIQTDTDARTRVGFFTDTGRITLDGERFDGSCIYTGALDELFQFCYGSLPYRSLDLRFEALDADEYQPASVVNYPNEEDFTRITEFKKLSGQVVPGHTAILREYPATYDRNNPRTNIPYYPILNPENKALYARYRALAEKIPNLHLCGRLAEYAYYNMDGAILSALTVARKIF